MSDYPSMNVRSKKSHKNDTNLFDQTKLLNCKDFAVMSLRMVKLGDQSTDLQKM